MVRSRLRLLMLICCLPFGVILGRLYLIQVIRHEEYKALADGRRRNIHRIPASRGRILARDGTILACDLTLFDLQFTLGELYPRERLFANLQKSFRWCREDPPPASDRQCTCKVLEELLLAALGSPQEMELESLKDGAPAVKAPAVDPAAVGWRLLASGAPPTSTRRFSRDFYQDLLENGLYIAPGPEPGISSLWIHPVAIAKLELTLLRLQRLCGVPYEILRAAVFDAEKELEKGKNSYDRGLLRKVDRPLLRDITREAVTEILYHPERFPGIRVANRYRRSYPLGESTGIITGYLVRQLPADPHSKEPEDAKKFLSLSQPNLDQFFEDFTELREVQRFADEEIGERGLESVYEERLRSRDGLRMDTLDAMGRPRADRPPIEPQNGEDLQTTLDAGLQAILYQGLKRQCGDLDAARAGSAAVMALDWNSGARDGIPGAILGLACYPTFDANLMRQAAYYNKLAEEGKLTKSAPFMNRPRTAALPPGSVFKLIVAAAAMESGIDYGAGRQVTQRPMLPDETFACTGQFDPKIASRYKCDHLDGHGMPGGVLNLRQAIQFSCNCYFYHLGQDRLRADILWAWARNFGYGRSPGIDLDRSFESQAQAEAGYLARFRERSTAFLSPIQMRNYGVGQEHVLASPLQVLRSVAGIALNGQALPWPYLVEPRQPEAIGISRPWTIPAIKEGMRLAVSEPTGTAGKPEQGLNVYSIAVKTGTAQIAEDKREYHAWIAGYAPADRPEIAFVICLENTPQFGGDATAPILREVLDYFARREPRRYRVEARQGPDPATGGRQ